MRWAAPRKQRARTSGCQVVSGPSARARVRLLDSGGRPGDRLCERTGDGLRKVPGPMEPKGQEKPYPTGSGMSIKRVQALGTGDWSLGEGDAVTYF